MTAQRSRPWQGAAKANWDADHSSLLLPTDKIVPESPNPSGSEHQRQHLAVPDVTGMGVVSAALAYAASGWFVLPTHPCTKHAGSVLGRGWPVKSSRDAAQINAWFCGSRYGLALHLGRSGAVAFDVDRVELLPELLARQLAAVPGPFQSTRVGEPARGHYLFAQPAGVDLGNGKGLLKGGWGDVRGKNGIIIVEPTTHEKHLSGGRYVWQRRGSLPVLPGQLLEALRPQLSLGTRRAVAASRGARLTRAQPSRSRFRRTTLEQIVERVLQADERNNAIFEASCRVGELIATGHVSRGVGIELLLRAGRAVGLDDVELIGVDRCSGTIHSGLRTGAAAVGAWSRC